MKTRIADLGCCKLKIPVEDRFFGDDRMLKIYMEEVDMVGTMMLYGSQPIRDGTMLDIGACMGVSCIPAVKRGYFDHAIAIEPHPDNFNLLVDNIAMNGLEDQILPIRAAVADLEGQSRLHRGFKNRVNHNSGAWTLANQERDKFKRQEVSDTVAVTTLKNILQNPLAKDITLVWADCQGAEPLILKSSRDLLPGVPWYIEVEVPFLETFQLKSVLIEEVTRRFKWFIDRREKVPQIRSIEEFSALYERMEERGQKLTNCYLSER